MKRQTFAFSFFSVLIDLPHGFFSIKFWSLSKKVFTKLSIFPLSLSFCAKNVTEKSGQILWSFYICQNIFNCMRFFEGWDICGMLIIDWFLGQKINYLIQVKYDFSNKNWNLRFELSKWWQIFKKHIFILCKYFLSFISISWQKVDIFQSAHMLLQNGCKLYFSNLPFLSHFYVNFPPF